MATETLLGMNLEPCFWNFLDFLSANNLKHDQRGLGTVGLDNLANDKSLRAVYIYVKFIYLCKTQNQTS